MNKCEKCGKTSDTGYQLPDTDVYGTGYTNCFICGECMEGFQIG